jgi:CubicO group peptidase (beta-lactamase class C family)
MCVVLNAAEQPAPASNSIRFARVDTLMRQEFAKSAAGGALTIGIIEQGSLAWTKSYGVTDVTAGSRPTSRTIYPIASVTKVVTGIMLLQLVERGVVHLTDPVERFVPEIRQIPNAYPWAPPVTLMQLATMTAGIDDGALAKVSEDTSLSTWDQRLVAILPSARYSFEPGTQREYSNADYAILGLALSRAAHRPYTEYIVAEIFQPLQMRDSSFSIGPDATSRFAYASADMSRLQSTEHAGRLPAFGVFSTLEDLVKLMQFQLGLGPESVLSHKTLEESFRLVVPSDGNLRYGDGMGYAAARNPEGSLVALGHGGHSRYIASYEYDRTQRSGIIVLTTHLTDEYKPLVRRSLQILHPSSTGGTALKPTEEH